MHESLKVLGLEEMRHHRLNHRGPWISIPWQIWTWSRGKILPRGSLLLKQNTAVDPNPTEPKGEY